MDNRQSLRIGEKFGPFEYTITEEMVDLHLAAIDNSDAAFKNLSQDGRRIIPPCFTTRDYVYLFLQKGIWGSGGIQTAQESEFYNPGYVGQRLVCTGEVIERYVKKNKHYMVFEYRVVDGNGNPIAKHRMTTIVF